MKTIVLEDKSYKLLKELLEEITEDYMVGVEESYGYGGSDREYLYYYGSSDEDDSVVGMANEVLSKLNDIEQRNIKIKSVVNDE